MRLTVELEPRSGQLEDLRRLVGDWAATVHADAWEVGLIATELVSNAFAVTPHRQPVELHLDRSGDEVRLTVRDRGKGGVPTDVSVPPPSSVRGRGLAIVGRIADRVLVRRIDGCTEVMAGIDVARG